VSYVRRKITATVALGTGTYGNGKATLATLEGLRMVVNITKGALPGSDVATGRIYGMPLDLMNQLTSLGKPQIYTRNNVISYTAGDDTAGMALVHRGILQEAWVDFGGAPEVSFNAISFTNTIAMMQPTAALSFQGSADVATIMSGIATTLGLAFENNGVVSKLSNPYFPGTPGQQMIACARAAGIEATIDGTTLAIWPSNGSRGGAIPVISPETGMMGYPTYTSSGIGLKTLYNPNIRMAAQVQVKSSLKAATSTWIVNAVSHELAAELPGGPWDTTLQGYRFGNPMTLPS
jgi:hypothetical protein